MAAQTSLYSFSGCDSWVQEFIQNLLAYRSASKLPELTRHRELPSSNLAGWTAGYQQLTRVANGSFQHVLQLQPEGAASDVLELIIWDIVTDYICS